MSDTKTILTYKERTVEMNDDNAAAAMQVLGNQEEEQLFLDFDTQYSDIALKEAIRGIKAVVKEAIRLGAERREVGEILGILANGRPIVYAAADAIDEAIAD